MKSVLYFKHDIYTLDDRKIKHLVRKAGACGYGIWWAVLETLYKEESVAINELADDISITLDVDFDRTKEIIEFMGSEVCGLLNIDNGMVSSTRVTEELEKDRTISEKRAYAGSIGGKARTENKTMLEITDKLEDDKIKLTVRFHKPTIDEVKAYCEERQNGIDAEDFVSFYESKGWVVGKAPMKDWKACIRTWENKRKQNTPASKTEYIPTASDYQGEF